MKLSLLTLVAAALTISGSAIAAPVVLESRALEQSLLERDVKIYPRRDESYKGAPRARPQLQQSTTQKEQKEWEETPGSDEESQAALRKAMVAKLRAERLAKTSTSGSSKK